MIGAGVLSLAWSVAQLGWIAGPLLMIVFAGITIISTNLLCDCYRYPDPECGPARIRSYMEAVRVYLGEEFNPNFLIFVTSNLNHQSMMYCLSEVIFVLQVEISKMWTNLATK